MKPSIGFNNTDGVLNVTGGVWLQYTWTESRLFDDYDVLKKLVKTEYTAELTDFQAGDRVAMDPYIFDLYNAVLLIEEYGEYLETLLWLEKGINPYTKEPILVPGR